MDITNISTAAETKCFICMEEIKAGDDVVCGASETFGVPLHRKCYNNPELYRSTSHHKTKENNMVPDAFYLVWKSGGDAPSRRHELIESAREEARRLAKDNHGIEFFVMRVVEGVAYREDPYRVRNFKKRAERTPEERDAARYMYPTESPFTKRG